MAVAADHIGGKMNYMCDWMSWINNGWIDTFRPMAYTGDVDSITTFTERYVDLAHQLSFLQMGIGPGYEGYPAIVNQLQMKTVMDNGGTGCAIFASQNLYNVPEAEEAMALNINRYGKVAPFGDFRTVLKESMTYLGDKMDRIYSSSSDFTEKDNLKQIIERVKGLRIENPSDFKLVSDELSVLKAYAGLIQNDVVRARVLEDVNYLVSLLDIKINRTLINYGHWDGKGTRPDISQFEFPAFEKIGDETLPEDKKKGCFGCQSGTGMMMSFLGAFTLMGLFLRKRNE
jgi:hypothetical protein